MWYQHMIGDNAVPKNRSEYFANRKGVARKKEKTQETEMTGNDLVAQSTFFWWKGTTPTARRGTHIAEASFVWSRSLKLYGPKLHQRYEIVLGREIAENISND